MGFEVKKEMSKRANVFKRVIKIIAHLSLDTAGKIGVKCLSICGNRIS